MTFHRLTGGFLPLPAGVRQTERFGADWRVRLWAVRGKKHSWPSGLTAGFEGIIVAWLFFDRRAR